MRRVEVSKQKLTPEEIEARIEAGRQAAEERRKIRAAQKSFISRARINGVRFATFGRLTVAYRLVERSFVYFAVAVRNPGDAEDVVVGKAVAAHRLLVQNLGAVVPAYSDRPGISLTERMDVTIEAMFGGFAYKCNDSRLND
jgi:hypothetical protein